MAAAVGWLVDDLSLYNRSRQKRTENFPHVTQSAMTS
jgi:hypothetical protein